MAGNTTSQANSQAETSSHQLALKTYDDPDAYEVYDVLLGGQPEGALIGGLGPGTERASQGPIAIESQTSGDKLCFDPATQTDSRMCEAATDYNEQNSRPRLLKAEKLRFGRKVELISLSDLDSTFADGIISGWKKFRNSHPDMQGYIGLLPVGLSADRNLAIVFLDRYCGTKCGAGGIVTLSKKNGIWRRNWDQLCSWIS